MSADSQNRYPIRKAVRQDASRLAEILIFAKRCAYRPIFKNDLVSFNEMQVLDLALSFCREEEMLRGVYVYDDGIVKGLIRCIEDMEENQSVWFKIEELYVDPFFQGQGVGSALMMDCMQRAEEHRQRQGFLWVLEKNGKARTFYEKYGFRFDGTKRLQEGTPEYLLRYTIQQN